MLQLLKASSHHSGAGRESWQALRPGSGPAQAMLVQRRRGSAFKPSLLGVLASIALPSRAHSHAHLVLLGELQPIIGLQPVDVVSEVRHRDGGMVTHACEQDKVGGGRGKRLGGRKARAHHVHSRPGRWAQGGQV